VAHRPLGARSEHHWLRLSYGSLGHLFPYLPHQPGHHKRVKAAAPLICKSTLSRRPEGLGAADASSLRGKNE
jgi:hypothetical protein